MQKQLTIRRFIAGNFLFSDDPEQVGLDESLLERGIIDSTGVLELIAFLEETYGIAVQDEEMVPENLDSVTAILRFLDGKKA